MPSSEQTPLLNGNCQRPPSFYSRVLALLKAEGEPSWLDSYGWFIFGSWANLLLLLVPVAAAAHYLNWDAPLRFGFSFVAIIPLAKVCFTCASPNLTRLTDAGLLSCLVMLPNRCPSLLGKPLPVC